MGISQFADALRVFVMMCFLVGGLCLGSPLLFAEETQVDLSAPDAIKQTLDQQIGKKVKVKLVSGQDLEGKVTKVGAQVVHLAELSGMDFFDAVVRLDQISAVILRARTK